MNRIRVLDCTLRDGGFVNNWKFGYNCIRDIVERLEQSQIDIIEVGYLRDYISYDKNSTEFPSIRSISKTLEGKELKAMMVALMDYGSCSIKNICDISETFIKGIRLTFRKKDMLDALDLAKEIKKKGYYLFLQPVAITDYTAKEVIDFIEKANKIEPYAVCMVDTYGFMKRKDLIKYFYLFDSSLNPKISLGYHSHNNYQLSYANAIELAELPTDRNIIIDSSVFGMGKGAGNLNTELLISYLNENHSCKYDVNQILEIISIYLNKARIKNFWGYNLKYYLAAINDCHHGYVQYLLDKKTLTISSINKILQSIDDNRKTRFDEKYCVHLYNKYQNSIVNDEELINKLMFLAQKDILLLAPGFSLKEDKKLIDKYILEKNPIIISINHYYDDYKQDYIFVSNSIRYSQLENDMIKSQVEIIATSNISPVKLEPNYWVNYGSLLLEDSLIGENASLMLIRFLIMVGVKKVTFAGFDGFQQNTENYYDEGIELSENLIEKNKLIKSEVHNFRNEIEIKFLTKSIYE